MRSILASDLGWFVTIERPMEFDLGPAAYSVTPFSFFPEQLLANLGS